MSETGNFYEKSSFRWAVIGGALFVTLAVIGSGFLQTYMAQKAEEEARMEAFLQQKAYEDEIRSWMTRIYQNLKLDHFLAAYQNIKNMPKPRQQDKTMVDEYLEVLHRIGEGLLKAGMLKDSELVYGMIREYEFNSEKASEALTEIDSRRKLGFARSYLKEGKRLIEQARFRNAFEELQKAEIELNSVRFNNFKGIDKEVEELKELMKQARFYTRIEEAQNFVDEAKRAIQVKEFRKTQDAMSKASNFTGRAAFIRPQAPEVLAIRKQLFALESELGFLIPNSMPLWNRKQKEMAGSDPDFFYLDSYEFDSNPEKENIVRIKINYMRRRDDRVFIVRYRIFLADNRSYFNGHFLTPDSTQVSDADLLSVTFEQEIPERFRGAEIRRLEVNVFSEKDEILSRISRAFRKAA